ncbi:MAG: histidine--tRNA ligase [Candidatus Omnitrophica bacterium]|nr:histidine--tRNA ligase [Candidatus Omnitrophota bacterium]MDD5310945.1 histidine--tRNA ligase [Candidatus Omnitrophota bacterium]MDD5545781.1 histidine--tRNA ligase [Candidatus Omnitrophota bacterium]
MKEQLKALRGTKDLLPKDARLWTILEEKARAVFYHFGYSEVRTPVIEESALFVRSLGQGTDIVEKQMFTFLDRGERSITLRPEATASVVRAYLENNLENEMGFAKLFYMGPMFRAERPQAGRMRQFHQIGVEAIGSYSPYLDAEVIALLASLLDSFNIRNYEIKINSLGCVKDKEALSNGLRQALGSRINNLCDDCKARYEKNILRVLDCKNDACRSEIKKIFKGTGEYLCPDCRTHFETVKKALDGLKINYNLEPYLVRGLDYYTKTTFEVVHKKLGAQDAIGAGGRYDNLVSDLGGQPKGACGFAIGMERSVMSLQDIPELDGGLNIYIATMGEEAYKLGFSLAMSLRGQGISAEADFEGKSLKAQMRSADRLGAKYVAIIGEDEIKNHTITLRNMSTKEQTAVPERSFASEMERIFIK